jgi:hypothetical protein
MTAFGICIKVNKFFETPLVCEACFNHVRDYTGMDHANRARLIRYKSPGAT